MIGKRWNVFRKTTSVILLAALALIIPMALHTLYDAGTIFNYPAQRCAVKEETTMLQISADRAVAQR